MLKAENIAFDEQVQGNLSHDKKHYEEVIMAWDFTSLNYKLLPPK